jgi:cell division septum initiation protein DivIVA
MPECQSKYYSVDTQITVSVREWEKTKQRIKELEQKLHHYEHPVHRCDKCHAQIIPRCKCGYQELEAEIEKLEERIKEFEDVIEIINVGLKALESK